MSSAQNPDLTGSPARLWRLVDERTRSGADTASLDRRIWDLFGERWAVVFTDLAGFSRQVAEFGVCHFLQIIHEHKKLLLPIVADHDGILLKVEADSFVILFRRPASALRCAVAMQQACARVNERRRPEEEILLCVGVGYGDVLRVGDSDVYGVEVNAASKLGEDTAGAGDILLTEAVRAACEDDELCRSEPLGTEMPGAGAAHRLLYR